ncbi:MAG: nucleotidyltransferase family protein [Ramlibacter sp.]|nr:nucleotidyltransferase family protein [Cryobacterium sp.]
MPSSPVPIPGLVLAAGTGSRYGTPKALVRGDDGAPWLIRTIRTLAAAGCSPVIVVLGARADEARALLSEYSLTAATDAPPATSIDALTPPVVVAQADDWAEGLSASLRTGLRAAAALVTEPDAVAIVPVDVPGLLASTVQRLIGPLPSALSGAPSQSGSTFEDLSGETGSEASVGPDTLRQARFHGRPGHPVVIGRAHWAELIRSAGGDTGARPYLQAHPTQLVECSDLETGLDVDRPD